MLLVLLLWLPAQLGFDVEPNDLPTPIVYGTPLVVTATSKTTG